MSETDDASKPVEGGAGPGDAETAAVPASEDETGAGTGSEDPPGSDASGAPDDGDARSVEATPATASDAFAALGNDVRTSVLESLAAREPQPFSALFESAPVDTTAGFAYHLRQLDGRFVRTDDEGYRLTHAGRRAARALLAGAYTERVAFDPIDLDEACPLCGEAELLAGCEDGFVTVACGACDRSILTLPLPPGGTDATPEALVESLDRHTRSRVSLAAEGTCPECAGDVEAELVHPPDGAVRELSGADEPAGGEGRAGTEGRAQAHVACPTCGWRLACPVAHAVLDHPAVVAFYHDHGRDVRERPMWNVGEEWRETVLSDDPWCVRVSTRLDDEVLSLLIGRDLTVVETARREVERP